MTGQISNLKTTVTASKLIPQRKPKKVDEESCRGFNADLMRAIVTRKMAKNKTFYETKVLPQ